MMLRCDHCRGKLGLVIHRYWRMRFCSATCTQAYIERLQGQTRAKIHILNRKPGEARSQGTTPPAAGFGQDFAA